MEENVQGVLHPWLIQSADSDQDETQMKRNHFQLYPHLMKITLRVNLIQWRIQGEVQRNPPLGWT